MVADASPLVVADTFSLTRGGLVLVFERDPDPPPAARRLRVRVTRPDGTAAEHDAQVEFALKPPGEVVVFLVPGATRPDIPVDSRVHVLEPTPA